jgi:hypothetical protein
MSAFEPAGIREAVNPLPCKYRVTSRSAMSPLILLAFAITTPD